MASTCVLCWTLCIILWSGLTKLYYAIATVDLANDFIGTAPTGDGKGDGKPSKLFDMRQLPPLEQRIDTIDLIRNICQSFEFCMQDEMRSMGPSAIIFPLQVVIDHLKVRP